MLALLLLIILGIDWASGYAIAGYCMTHGVSPLGYAFWQSFGPFILLLVIQLIRRDIWLNHSQVTYSVLCAIFGIVLPNLLIYFAARHVQSGLLTVIANISPIFTYVLAVLFREENFRLNRAFFVIVGLAGVALIVLPSLSGLTVSLGAKWLYIALLIPLSYAFSAVYISKFHPGKGNILGYALWMLMVSTLCISPLAVINHGYYELQLGDMKSLLIILEIILSTCGYVLLFIILKMVGAVYYSLVNAVAALSGIAYGYLLFGQRFTLTTYLAICVILIAIAGLTYSQKFRSENKS